MCLWRHLLVTPRSFSSRSRTQKGGCDEAVGGLSAGVEEGLSHSASRALSPFHLFPWLWLCVRPAVSQQRYPRERGNPLSYFSPLHTSLPNKWDPEHANSQSCRPSSEGKITDLTQHKIKKKNRGESFWWNLIPSLFSPSILSLSGSFCASEMYQGSNGSWKKKQKKC